MLKCNGKISARQCFAMFVILTLSPGIRIFPTECADFAGKAAWLAPVISAVPLVALYLILDRFFRKKNIKNLSDAFTAALGTPLSKAVLTLYLMHYFLLFCIYIRYYAARFLSTIYTDADIRFFIITILAVAYIAARGKIEALFRFSEITFLFFTLILFTLFAFLMPEVKLANIYPVTFDDTLPAMRASLVISAIWGYMLLPFFLGENIADKENIKKYGKQSTIYIVFITVCLMVTVVGILSHTVAKRMSYAFFAAVKLITIIESYDRFEPIVLTVWVFADFIIITFFALVIMNIIKNLFSLSETKNLATPVMSLGYIGSRFLASNIFELQVLSVEFALYANLILMYLIPVLTFLIGKIRKKF